MLSDYETQKGPLKLYTRPENAGPENEGPGARFTKYLTIYRKIIFSLSQDRLTIVTYHVLRFLLGISLTKVRTISQTILRFCKRIVPEKSLASFVRRFANETSIVSRS